MVDKYSLIPIGGAGGPAAYCLPPVNGIPTLYRFLLPDIGDRVRLIGVPTLGVFLDVPPLPTLEDQANSIVSRISMDLEPGNFLLLGYSMGGKVAYETAIRLSAMGLPPKEIVIIDSFFGGDNELPETPDGPQSGWVWDLFFQVYFHTLRQRVMSEEEFLSFLSCAEEERFLRLRHYIELHRRPYDYLENISDTDLRKLTAFHYSQCRSWARYTPPPTDLSLTYIEARQSDNFGQAALWKQVARGGCEIFAVEGTHTSILFQPDHTRQLAQCLRQNVPAFRGI
ncbi:thioesterase domain-containing protein [Rhizobium leguminosarum]|uniref:thioesterase domain-containing protein n=1 Tax=Rhizobium leguminosarum TaxID=384 RepID=UPI003ECFFD08